MGRADEGERKRTGDSMRERRRRRIKSTKIETMKKKGVVSGSEGDCRMKRKTTRRTQRWRRERERVLRRASTKRSH